MQLSILLLLVPTLLSSFVAAGPINPRSTQPDNAARQVARRRQATTKDIVRRLREGPRRRQTSAGVCLQTAGTNLLVNGGFQDDASGDPPTSWTFTPGAVSTSGNIVTSEAAYTQTGETNPVGFEFTQAVLGGGGTGTLSQTTSATTPICTGVQYRLTYDYGINVNGVGGAATTACVITPTITDTASGETQTGASHSGECTGGVNAGTCDPGANVDYIFGHANDLLTSFASEGTLTLSFALDCSAINGNAYISAIDNVVLARA